LLPRTLSDPRASAIILYNERIFSTLTRGIRMDAIQTTPKPAAADLRDPSLYFNRELSWIEFNWRVLEEAFDRKHPLLERVKFLSIFSSNLDEFFMIRVSGLKDQVTAGVVNTPPDGMTPAEQLAAIRTRVLPMMRQQRRYYHEEVRPELVANGIHLLRCDDIGPEACESLRDYFEREILPVLTPLGFDSGRPFPHISNLSLNLALTVRKPGGEAGFARVKVPTTLPRLIALEQVGLPSSDGIHLVWLEDVIAANLGALFPGNDILQAFPFRVIRDTDMEIQEDEASDLLETIEEGLIQRQFGPVVQLQVDENMPQDMVDMLVAELEVTRADVYPLASPLGMSDLIQVWMLNRPDLKDPPFTPAAPPMLRELRQPPDIFAAIRSQDILLHHPYDSFSPVLNFIRSAAADPDVLAIKSTLYRVGRNAPVVQALLDAQRNGKQVAVLVELKARFDEESNIGWARALEAAGVHVVYGLVGLKTHSKITLVVRRETGGLRRYLHLATGNYNAVTAGIYTDLGLFTCDDDLGADATEFFNSLTGYSGQRHYRSLLVAPGVMRERVEALIDREIEHALQGRPGRLIFKMNALVDDRLIRSLYRASQAGVQCDLIVRGICCLRPGLPGYSDNIRVISIVGRFLEHSRIYFFGNGGQSEVYLGSADLMPRNLDRRVETLFPVTDPAIRDYIRYAVLEVEMNNNVRARDLLSDGSYTLRHPEPGQPAVESQQWLLAHPSQGGHGELFRPPANGRKRGSGSPKKADAPPKPEPVQEERLPEAPQGQGKRSGARRSARAKRER
jgi:polyphosphate kinase